MEGGAYVSGGVIRPEDLTDAVWSHIFLEKEAPADTNIPKELMQRMRDEFNYWYPFDMRVSGFGPVFSSLTSIIRLAVTAHHVKM